MERELDRLKARGARGPRHPRVERTRLGINVSLGGQAAEAVAALREIGDATGDAAPGGAITLVTTARRAVRARRRRAGEHAVAVSADGYFPIEKKQARALKGATAVVEIELVPAPGDGHDRRPSAARGSRSTGRGMASPRHELRRRQATCMTDRYARAWPRAVSAASWWSRAARRSSSRAAAETARRARPCRGCSAARASWPPARCSRWTGAIIGRSRASTWPTRSDRAGNQARRAATRYDRAVRTADELRHSRSVLGGGALAAGGGPACALLCSTRRRAERLAIAPLATRRTAAGITASRRV
jgi:hypothetical protein